MKNLYDYERTQSATTDLPFGALKNESSPGKQDGTDIVAEHIQDLAYSLYQVLQLAGINPNGELEDGNNKTQFIESLTNIGVFRYSDKTSYNYGVFAWQVIGNTFTLYRSLKNSNSDDVNNNESWLKILEIGADNKINFNVDTNILGLSANPSLSNLSEAGEDRLNVSKMYETGAVSNDTKGFEALLKRAHSTFDKSKFEVVGSPTITDNGIASGFSIGNSINLGKYNIQNELHIKCNSNNVNLTGTNRGAICSWYQNEQNYFRLFWYSNTQLRFDYFKQDESSVTANSFNYDANGNYIFDIIYKNNKLSLLKDGEVIHTYNGAINLTALNLVDGQLGVQTVGSWYLENGSIDLKFIAIWADGMPVFNGNKTGLYVAKTDNYEKVGDVVISNDGVASGFSTSNYITYNKQTLGDNFDIIFPKFKTSNVNQDANYLFSTSGHGLRVQLNSGKIRTLAFYGSDQYPVIQGLTQLQNNAEYLYKISRKKEDSNYTLTAFLSSDNGKTWVQQSQVTMTQDLYNSGSVGYLGGNLNSSDQIFNGSIDLNSFKIYVDGNLVYQPCLKIPYTEADSTSRIVDVAYRDRVQDLYEQNFKELFYTIDEQNQNFTLPAGDIYGMIENSVKKTGDIMTGSLIIDNIELSSDTSNPLQFRMNKASNYGNTTYGNINFADNNGKYISLFGGLQKTNGAGGVRLGAWDASNQFKQLLLLTTDDNPAIIIESYQNGKSGYIIYSNKLCKQWGYATYPGGAYVNFDVHLTKSYKDTNYIVLTMAVGSNNSGDSSAFRLISQATNSFNMKYVGSGNNYGSVSGGNWFTIGYIL